MTMRTTEKTITFHRPFCTQLGSSSFASQCLDTSATERSA